VTLEEAFLQAVVDDPEDDGIRLIFADWLEEQGNPRGAFIRAQVEAAGLPPGDPGRLERERGAHDLLARHAREWIGPVANLAEQVRFQRGFIEKATLRTSAFLEGIDTLFRSAPIRYLKLRQASSGSINSLTRLPELARLRGLDLRGNYLNDDALTRMLRCPHLRNLRTLDLGDNQISLGGMQPVMPRETELTQLTTLDLSGNPLSGRAAVVLASAPFRSTLEALDLGNTNLLDQEIDEESLSLLTSAAWHRLTALRLGANHLGPGDMQRLGASGVAPRLRILDLSHNPLGDQGARSLAQSPLLPSLEVLDLDSTQISNRAVPMLARGRGVRSVRILKLANNRIRDRGLLRLLDPPQLRHLVSLDLSNNRITEEGIRSLAQVRLPENLVELDLRGNPVGPAGQSLVRGSATLRWVVRLN
jgi:uncharacterized protein (TIGR02996 family)